MTASGVVYARQAGQRELTFDFAEGLLKDNLLVVDRETASVWSQLKNGAISGPLKGHPLRVLPSLQTTYKHWLSLHPKTRVMIIPGQEGRPFFYRGKRRMPLGSPRKQDVSALGLGLSFGGKSLFLPLPVLASMPNPLPLSLGGQRLLIHHETKAYSAWATDPAGHLLVGVLAYRRGWLRFHPHSKIFSKQTLPAKAGR